MKEPTQASVCRFVFFSLLIAVTLLVVACANSTTVPLAKAEPTIVREIPVATSGKVEPTPVRASAVATPANEDRTTARATAVATLETSQWKQYSSKKYEYEFWYPESCKISERDESLNVGGRIELSILESNGLGLDEYVTRFVDNRTRNNGWTVESIKGGSIGGQEAKIVDYRFGGPNRFGTATFAVRGDKAYVWGFTTGGFTCDEPKVYVPILATFRFANIASTPTARPSLPMTPTVVTSPSPEAEPSPTSAMVNIPFTGISGTVALRSAGASTEISLAADDFGSNTTHAARILTGTCATPGANVLDLPASRADSSGKANASATVGIPLSSLTDGNHVVVTYFGPTAESGRVIVCADIPSKGAAAGGRNGPGVNR